MLFLNGVRCSVASISSFYFVTKENQVTFKIQLKEAILQHTYVKINLAYISLTDRSSSQSESVCLVSIDNGQNKLHPFSPSMYFQDSKSRKEYKILFSLMTICCINSWNSRFVFLHAKCDFRTFLTCGHVDVPVITCKNVFIHLFEEPWTLLMKVWFSHQTSG